PSVFAVDCCYTPGILPPVPTRRSSDLEVGRNERVEKALANLVGAERRLRAESRLGHRIDGGGGGGFSGFAQCTGEVHLGGARFQDRKSTRLNSSHVKISYAVFCLKKKK